MLSRRAFIQGSATGALAGFLAGCGGGGSPAPTASPSPTPIASAPPPPPPLGTLGAPPPPPQVFEAQSARAAELGLEAIYLSGIPYKGRQTRIFAIAGFPRNMSGPFPAVVLAHGGGGTAFADWVKLWNDAGFAAIAPALEGQTDIANADPAEGRWVRHEYGGPARVGVYEDSAEALEDQWMYHAQFAVAAAHSFLAARPDVVATKIGLCGISWGGVVAATSIGYDARIAFAISLFGSGYLAEMPNIYGKAGENPRYATLWEPGLRLGQARMPTMWITGLAEQDFSLIQQAKTYKAVSGLHSVSIQEELEHGHVSGWSVPDSYAFARSVVDKGFPLAVQTARSSEAGNASATFSASVPLTSPRLLWTVDRGHSGSRVWQSVDAMMSTDQGLWHVSGHLPLEATAWFFNTTSSGLTVSSDLETRGPQ
jgi:dienelactone hydrolase